MFFQREIGFLQYYSTEQSTLPQTDLLYYQSFRTIYKASKAPSKLFYDPPIRKRKIIKLFIFAHFISDIRCL